MTTPPHSSPKLDVLLRFTRYGLRYKKRLFYVLLSSVIISILTLLLVSSLKPIIDIIFNQGTGVEVSSGRLGWVSEWVTSLKSVTLGWISQSAQENRLQTLAFVCGMILVLVFCNGVFHYIQTYMVQWIGNRVILDLQRDLFNTMLSFNTSYYARQKVGYLISYYTVDTRVIGLTVFHVFGRLLLDPIMLLAVITVLFWMQWKLTLLYALIFPWIILTIRYFAHRNRRAGRRAQHITARLGAFLQEHFSAIRLIQGYNMYGRQRRLLERETRGVFDASMSMARAMAASSPINEFLGIFAVCCVLMLAGYIMFAPQADPAAFNGSDFVVYAVYLAFLYQPIKRIERAIQQIQHGLAAAERVFTALDIDAVLPQSASCTSLHSLNQHISFDHVSFSYDGETDVLQNVSFTAPKGERIAIVGPSGAGKTTLVNLIPRFYDPTEGCITWDGTDIRDIQVNDLRNHIGMVFQDVLILGDSVRVNITCGEESYSQEEIEEAARAAFAHEFIMELPDGYDTLIGERGESLSGGQCQRIAIARAFLRNAPVLILDEATSSLDSESELHIKQSLDHLMKGRTTFVIAHRLSTILNADRILVLDRGILVDSGPHDELLQRCSLYQRLYNLQFQGEKLSPTEF